MKTLALETILVAQSIVFWVFALPFALVAFPLLALIQKADELVKSVRSRTDQSHLSPRFA